MCSGLTCILQIHPTINKDLIFSDSFLLLMHLASQRKRDLIKKILMWIHFWTYEIVGVRCNYNQSAKRETSCAQSVPSRRTEENIRNVIELLFHKVLCQVFWYLRLNRKQRDVIFCDFVQKNIVILSSCEKCSEFAVAVGKKCAQFLGCWARLIEGNFRLACSSSCNENLAE